MNGLNVASNADILRGAVNCVDLNRKLNFDALFRYLSPMKTSLN